MTRMRIARECRQWSLAEVGNRTQTARGDLSKWERGIGAPYPAARRRLARTLGIQAEWLQENIPDSIARVTVRTVREQQAFRAGLRIPPDELVQEIGREAARELVARFPGWSLPTKDQFRRLAGAADRAWRRARAS
jgi:transcriptional regulator with XRE-family HTH domain